MRLVTFITAAQQKWYNKGGRGRGVCACVHLCNCISTRKDQRMCPSPNDDVNIMKACSWFFSPQGSHMLHTNPPVSQHVTHQFYSTWPNCVSMSHIVLLCSLIYVLVVFLCVNRSTWSQYVTFFFYVYELLGRTVLQKDLGTQGVKPQILSKGTTVLS